MEARLCCEKPDEIRFNLTITGTAGEFCKLGDILQDSGCDQTHPVCVLSWKITDLLVQARKIYWPPAEKPE